MTLSVLFVNLVYRIKKAGSSMKDPALSNDLKATFV